MTLPRQSDAPEIVDGEPTFAVVPWSAEVLDLAELPVEQIARVLDETREFEYDRLRSFKRELQEEILRRMDEQAKAGVQSAWTMRPEGWKLQGDGPNRTEYDVDALRGALASLVLAGEIAKGVPATIIVPAGWKVAQRELNQLLKLGGEVKDRIEACRLPSSKPRGVRVSRA